VVLGEYEYQNNKKVLSALLDALQDPDVRISAINAITYISHDPSILDEANAEKFKKVLLEHKDSYVKQKAVETIGRIGDSGFVPVLIEVIKHDDDSYTQIAVGKSIAKIADESSIPALINLLKEPDVIITKNDLRHLVKNIDQIWNTLIEKGFINTEGKILDKIWEPFALTNDNDILSVVSQKEAMEISALLNKKVLSISNPNTQAAVAVALRELGAKSAIPALAGILKEKSSHRFTISNPAKEAAIDALLILESKDNLFPQLIDALDDTSEDVREKAARALGCFGNMDRAILLPALIDKFKDHDYAVRNAAIKSLVQIGDVSAIPPLIDLLENEKETHAAWALGEIGNERAIEALQHVGLEAKSEDLRKMCKEALKKLQETIEQTSLTQQFEETTEEKIQKASQEIQNKSDVLGYAKGLEHPDPYVRAVAALGIKSFSRHQAYFGSQPNEELMNQLAEMVQKEEPLVRIEAAAAYFGWFYLAKKEILAEIIVHVVDLLDNQDKYVRNRAFELCYTVTSLDNLHDIDILGEKLIDALVNKIRTSKDEETRSRARYYLGAASYFFRSKRALAFMLDDIDDFELNPKDYGYPPHQIIVLLNAKEYIPSLKQKLQTAKERMRGVINATLMKLGVDVYNEKDFSSPSKVVINFWKAIEQKNNKQAQGLLDSSRLDEKVIQEIINDHKEVLKHVNFYQLEYDFSEAAHFTGILCVGEEGYADKNFGSCLEDVYSLRMSFPGGPVFDYYLKQNKDGSWLIHEIKPKLSEILKDRTWH